MHTKVCNIEFFILNAVSLADSCGILTTYSDHLELSLELKLMLSSVPVLLHLSGNQFEVCDSLLVPFQYMCHCTNQILYNIKLVIKVLLVDR